MTHPTTPPAALPYLDITLSIAARVRDLLSRLTLDEKIAQLDNAAPAIPRLNIPAYNYWGEALHGVARNGRATVFPQAIGMAATWDPALIGRVASAIGDEGRAKYHAALRRKGETDWYQGLTFWSPNINIFRDPRWGRGQETWGEDPFLTGEMGAAFVRGLQGDHPTYLKAAACAKHFAVHSGPESLRHGFNAQVSPRDLRATYLPAFETLVREAKVEAVMGAYNRVNGEPCCASQVLLANILRGEWGFDGHVVSDCGALDDIHLHHKVTADAAETVALALKRGCDLCCGVTNRHLGEAVQRGLVAEADIDRALGRLLTTRFKLGMFDPPEAVPYAATPMSVVGSDAHRALAYESALKSVVLLKNRDSFLPLTDRVRSLHMVGPAATSAEALLGNYYGLSDGLTTLLEGVVGRVPEGTRIAYRMGSQFVHPNANAHDWLYQEVLQSDAVIACVGLSPQLEGEEGDAIESAANGDRADIGLPPIQVKFIKKLAASGARIVLVVTGGAPIALGEVADLAEAVLFVWYPGQEGGRAVADILFGNATPSGKLPLTFPRSADQLPPFESYAMAGRTYRYMDAEPLYPFGFGLSYTTFAYSDLRLAEDIVRAGRPLSLEFTVTNTGAVEAEEVAQVYLTDLAASVPVPRHSLVGFQRVRLAAGASQTLRFTLTPQMMMLVDEDGRRAQEPGRFRVAVGGCSPGARGEQLGAPKALHAEFVVM
ncbi:MAG: glycoside hydrolase family 3 N-terminal domain-containing protein [Anaerolineae bacterium]